MVGLSFRVPILNLFDSIINQRQAPARVQHNHKFKDKNLASIFKGLEPNTIPMGEIHMNGNQDHVEFENRALEPPSPLFDLFKTVKCESENETSLLESS